LAKDAARRLVPNISSAVLVEGVSDAAAIGSLSDLIGLDLERERVCVIPMGGVTNVTKYLASLGSGGLGVRVAGLCDAGEERHVRQGLERAGLGQMDSRDSLAAAGFFVCVDDLEDELIRALGTTRVEQILDAQGDLRAFRTFQNQPAQRDRRIATQLHRFFGTISGRKERYGKLLVEGLDLPAVPEPLAALLRFVTD
jgi:hypothetical protein